MIAGSSLSSSLLSGSLESVSLESRCNEGKQIAKREEVTALVRGVENRTRNRDEPASMQNPATFCEVKRPAERGVRSQFFPRSIDFIQRVGYANTTFAIQFAKR
jgi:hypothetical protein